MLPKKLIEIARVKLATFATQLLHHALHLLELTDKRSDFLHLHAAPFRDTLFAAALDQIRIAALLGRH